MIFLDLILILKACLDFKKFYHKMVSLISEYCDVVCPSPELSVSWIQRPGGRHESL